MQQLIFIQTNIQTNSDHSKKIKTTNMDKNNKVQTNHNRPKENPKPGTSTLKDYQSFDSVPSVSSIVNALLSFLVEYF